jgi:hypothetical protein
MIWSVSMFVSGSTAVRERMVLIGSISLNANCARIYRSAMGHAEGACGAFCEFRFSQINSRLAGDRAGQ